MDFLHDFGSSALLGIWVPLGLWSILAPLALALSARYRAHPLLQMRLRQAVLASLPAGLLFLNLIPNAPAMLDATPFQDWLIVVGDQRTALLTPEAMMDVRSTWQSGLGLFTLILLGLSIAALIRHGVTHFSLRKSHLNSLKLAPKSLRILTTEIALEMRIEKPFRLMLAPPGTMPHTFGWRKAVIVLPDEELDSVTTRLILTHEFSHLRRGDFAAQYLELVAKSMFGLHPTVHRLVREIHLYRELVCDAEVIHIHPGLIKSYAALLLDFASLQTQPQPRVVLSMATSPKHIQERIRTMKTPQPTPSRFSAIAPFAAFILISGLLASGRASTLQPPPPPPDAPVPEVFIVVEQMPEPIGGMKAIYDAIVYPEIAKKAGIEGRVVLQFVVDEEGNVTEPRVIRGIGGGCDEAALNAVKDLKFIPGMQRGRAVKVQFQLPIVFRLPTEDAPAGVSVQQQRVRTDAPNPVISGRIIDSNRKDALIGANIMFKKSGDATWIGAATGNDGGYVLSLTDAGTYIVRVTYVGYATTVFTLDIGARERYSVNVSMPKVAIQLDEIERN